MSSKVFSKNPTLENHRDFKLYLKMGIGPYCGFFLGKKTAVKVKRLHDEYLLKVKECIGENLNDVRVSSWTLDYSEGVQRTVNYHESIHNNDESKLERLKYFDSLLTNLQKQEDVFEFNSYEDAIDCCIPPQKETASDE